MVGWEVPIGAAIAFAAGAIATGWAQSRIGAAGAGAIAEKPETAGSIIIIEADSGDAGYTRICDCIHDHPDGKITHEKDSSSDYNTFP